MKCRCFLEKGKTRFHHIAIQLISVITILSNFIDWESPLLSGLAQIVANIRGPIASPCTLCSFVDGTFWLLSLHTLHAVETDVSTFSRGPGRFHFKLLKANFLFYRSADPIVWTHYKVFCYLHALNFFSGFLKPSDCVINSSVRAPLGKAILKSGSFRNPCGRHS